MADTQEIKVPDIGGFDSVPVIEVLVAVGDSVAKEQSLVTLESDKATMEIPSSAAGTVKEVKVKVGDEVAEGSVLVVLEAEAGTNPDDGEAGAGRSSASSSSAAAQGKKPAQEARDSNEADGAESASGASSGERGASEEVDTAARASTESGTSPEGYSLRSTAAAAAGDANSGSHAQTPGPEPAAASGREPDMTCQLLVLGSGPGGYTAAFRGADIDQDVILVERYATLGGVCLNVGCIPSKALLHAAEVIDAAESFAAHGISFGKPKLDLDKLRDYKTKVVGKLTGGLTSMSKSRKVRVVTGVGTFVSPHELEVQSDDGKKLIRFENAIIAAGSESVKLPAFPWDDERIVDSTGALELRDVPKTMLVVGGGIIGLEMATVYAALGSEVTIVEFLDQLIPGADADLVKPLAQRLGKRVKGIHLKTKVTSAKATKKGIEVGYEGDNAPETTLFDRVLVAVGRSPNGAKLGADKAGVAVTERGFINVDQQMRTNVAHIYAIGDLVGQPMLAHKATHEAKVAAEAAAGMKSFFDARVIPSVAYTDPELAWVGVTEREAREKGLKIGVGKFPWAASGRAIGMDRTEGMTKLIFDEETHRIVGGGIVGVHAGDLIAEIALAIEMGAEAVDIGRTIHPHPTLSESVGMGAEVYEGTITDLYIPKKKK